MKGCVFAGEGGGSGGGVPRLLGSPAATETCLRDSSSGATVAARDGSSYP